MSINAIGSLYEYYYAINRQSAAKKNSPIEKEMREYGLVPTDNDTLNIALLKKAKNMEQANNTSSSEASKSDRPWASLMYQLNIPFNDDPKDDIEDIKDELAILTRGMDDEELLGDLKDLEDYVDKLYINFSQNSSGSINSSLSLSNELNNLALLNRASLL